MGGFSVKMMFMRFFVAVAVLCAVGAASPSTISVYYNTTTDSYSAKHGIIDPTAAATASFDAEAFNKTGWAKLQVSSAIAQHWAYYAAGMAEGLLTCKFVAAVAQNNDDPRQNPQVTDFAEQAEAWTRAQAAANPDEDLWRAVGTVLAQFDGLVAGYNQSECSAAQPLTSTQMWLMQMDGDLEDIKNKFPQAVTATAAAPIKRPQHCSSLVKLAPNNSDLFFGHATWDIYNNAAPRIFKTYTLPVTIGAAVEQRTTHFSGTGPWLSSVDDFYAISSASTNMVVMETSNTVLNASLYKKVVPQSLLCWLRAIVSNRLAVDGASWAGYFGTHHSGSYTNQWQVIDLSKFTPNKPVSAGLLTILEELPGLIHWEDMTHHLQSTTYWPSYNVPYFDNIRALDGDADRSWSTAPRAKLFAMLHRDVESMESMQHIMRWNDYRSTPSISGGDPCNAIACRADLRSSGSHPLSAFGAIDAKASSYRTMHPTGTTNTMSVWAEAGPTHDQQPEFCWNSTTFDTPHVFHPACFAWGWDKITPAL